MTSRKLSPMVARTVKTLGVSPEYIEATQSLDEPTLTQACQLALDDTETDSSKLLEVYRKCQGALKIIQKHKYTVAVGGALTGPPGAPNIGSQGIASRPLHRGSLPKLTGMNGKKPAAIHKGGVMPMMRTAMAKPGGRMRKDSDADLGPSSKKARLNPPAADDPIAPPQSALNFLAKLNKDGSGAKNPTTSGQGQGRNSQRTTHRRSSS